MSWFCNPCQRHFVSRHSLYQHYNNSALHADDYICSDCSVCYEDYDEYKDHRECVHEYPFHCQECGDMYRTQDLLEMHMEEEHTEPQWECDVCDRQFANENSLRMHMNSRIHRGASITCPWCKKTYTTATGLSHHLESGSCRTGINRETIYQTIRQRDPRGVFTHKLLEYPSTERFNQTVSATAKSWNGTAYECPLCDREYRTLVALNQHLNSSIHQQNLYHCPRCNKQAKTLAALLNHFESESCGFVTFDGVQRNVEGIVTGGRMIQF
ncbi:hypothetical protein BZA77DRAFT_261318 [Pyronema omphalodes]|nr:hypothetical protein BZA77DRAFT_261318 [Pyronema omphalodes]